MHAILLALALVTYGGNSTIPFAAGSESSVIQPAPTVPANTGYEIVPPVENSTVSLAGNISHPGEYPFYPGMTVADLISLGGSFVHDTDYENLRIVRETPNGDDVYYLNWNVHWQTEILLHPDDVLVVPYKGLQTL